MLSVKNKPIVMSVVMMNVVAPIYRLWLETCLIFVTMTFVLNGDSETKKNDSLLKKDKSSFCYVTFLWMSLLVKMAKITYK